MNSKTYSPKPTDITRTWYLIDASDVAFGRIATQAARMLIGKDKPMFASHIDCGDYVIIINTDKLGITGDKLDQKMYYHHSGHAGGLKSMSLRQKVDRDSTEVLWRAVRGMLPVNKLRPARLARLKIYPNEEHNQRPQKPIKIDMKAKK
jgi:large subunit ribosomal protein L13